MKWYFIKTNRLIKRIFADYVWDIPSSEKKVYLTFDDGPTPEITTWVLNQLNLFGAKATFFCIGNNIEKHPDLFQSLVSSGHIIGNHTYNHSNGWKTKTADYVANTILCSDIIQQLALKNSKLFRPPYGKIKHSQAKELQAAGYKIIMWDVLSADFDKSISPQQCFENVVKNIVPGSIIVFHDSKKAFRNLEYTLPKTLQFLKENQYRAEGIF